MVLVKDQQFLPDEGEKDSGVGYNQDMKSNYSSPARVRCPFLRVWRRSFEACARAGFTLIELLVVIAIIGLLISMLLPSLAKARQTGRMTRELSTAGNVMLAYTMYADQSRGMLMPGYATSAMVNGPVTVTDSNGERLTNELAQRYPWRLAPFMDYDFRGLYENVKILTDLRDHQAEYTGAGVTYEYVISLFPSLGLNCSFVGGNDRRQEFDASFNRVFGRVYAQRLDAIQRPSQLMVFASARSERQASLPLEGAFPGFFRIEPPVFLAGHRDWQDAFDAQASLPGLNSGFIDLRYSGKGVAARADGHASLMGWDEFNDMRNWADQATSEAWGISPR